MKPTFIRRCVLYALGVVFLALGGALGTKTALGISPVNALPFALSHAFGGSFSTYVFAVLLAMIAIQFIIRGRQSRWQDLLQFPFSLFFSWLMGLFDSAIPMPEPLWMRCCVLVASIVTLALGVTLMVNMRILPNPTDGLSTAIAWKTGKDVGFGKNCVDISCVVAAFFIDLLFGTLWTSIGVATVIASVCIGRCVYLFNRLLKKKLLALAGLQ